MTRGKKHRIVWVVVLLFVVILLLIRRCTGTTDTMPIPHPVVAVDTLRTDMEQPPVPVVDTVLVVEHPEEIPPRKEVEKEVIPVRKEEAPVDTVVVEQPEQEAEPVVIQQPVPVDTVRMPELPEEPVFQSVEVKPVVSSNWAIKTNLLYDALLIPNVGVEYGFCKNWSVSANWMYAWWKNDVDRRWRVYGGDVALRRWFGCKAETKPLTGHHLGIYAQALTYDFCMDEKGYMGGEPGGNLWDKLHFALGVEYGYSLPIARRLNLDFTVGVGYMGGTYHEYNVVDDCKVWQATKNRRWFGPTKVEVSLVWHLGSFYNKVKGGKR